MKHASTIYSVQSESNQAMFEPRIGDEMRLEEPRFHAQRGWDKMITSLDQAHAALRCSRATTLAKLHVN